MQERKYDEAIVKRRIKQLLKETHTTRTKLCDSIGVDYAYFTKALNFKQGIGFGINTVINVADYFDVSVDYLLGRTVVRKIGIKDSGLQRSVSGLGEVRSMEQEGERWELM